MTSGNLDSLSPVSSTSTNAQRQLPAKTTNSENQRPQSSRLTEKAITENNQIRMTSSKHVSLSPVSSTSTDAQRRLPTKTTISKNQQLQSSQPKEGATIENNQIRMTSSKYDSLCLVSSTSIDAQRQLPVKTNNSENQRPQSSRSAEKTTTENNQIRMTSRKHDSLSPVSSTSTDAQKRLPAKMTNSENQRLQSSQPKEGATTKNNQIRMTSRKHDSLSPVSSTSTDAHRRLLAKTTSSENQQLQSSQPIERATTESNQIRTNSDKHDSLSPVSSTSTINQRRPPVKMTSGKSSDKKKSDLDNS